MPNPPAASNGHPLVAARGVATVISRGPATTAGLSGASTAAIFALVSAIIDGHADGDTWRAAGLAVALLVVTQLGRYAQAVAAIIGDALERRATTVVGELDTVELEGSALADARIVEAIERLRKDLAAERVERVPPRRVPPA